MQHKGLAVASGISRRTVMKGAAWSLPVIAIAGAAPASAVSGCVPTGGVLYFVGLGDRGAATGPVTAELYDCDGVAATADVVSQQNSELVLLDNATGTWWFRDSAAQNGCGKVWRVAGTPPIESIWAGQFGIDANGNVYQATMPTNGSFATTTATPITGASNIVQVYDSDGTGTTYALDAGGAVWRLSGSTWRPLLAPDGTQLVIDSMADSDEVRGNPVFISATGQVWTARPGARAEALPQGGPTAPDDVVEVVGNLSTFHPGALYARDSNGALWSWNGSAWRKVTDGPVTHLTYSYNDSAMYVEGGEMYYVATPSATPQQYTNLPAGFDPNMIVDTVQRNGPNEGWWAQLSDGTWWGSTNATSGVFQVVGTPGNTVTQITADGFALAGTPAGCEEPEPACIPLAERDKYQAVISTTPQTAGFPNVAASGTPHYDVPLNTHVVVENVYQNTGTEPWPVGTQIWVELSGNQRDLHAQIVGTSGTYASALGTPVYDEVPGGSSDPYGTRYVYTTVGEVPPGASITVTWEFWASTMNAWNGFYTLARVIIPPELSCENNGTSILRRLSVTGNVGGTTPAWYYVVRT
ncbi:hypothetical protein FVO59_08820 [Microbacterium esteraromaticum]|uniref:Uncharacterized protein n=1 Tax=Microbacterium esteraromaticum TaxID=57043 RepID=A0A7D7WIM0_9MICO|nr:hypothetical protein FVO59_08820 [Microbacterium esteraromaticum]